MKYVFDDGGRADAGFRGTTGDRVARAIANATQQPYRIVYDDLNRLAQSERLTKRHRRGSNARLGVNRISYEEYLTEVLGYTMLVEIPPVVFDCDLSLKNPREDRESFLGPNGAKKQKAAVKKKEQLMLAWRRRLLDHALIHLPKGE
jgi:hypothetical protein